MSAGGDSPPFDTFSFSLFCYDIMGCSWSHINSKVALGFDSFLAIFSIATLNHISTAVNILLLVQLLHA